ncbi:MAG TPA: hypothetical protein VGO56_00095 [Pyrinomonadaceae bacterium]|jgi:hypothetical protein|nr:hypothetical protein [Pyrinomonadaceae bacterium]
MDATLTENEFSKHVNTKFRVDLDGENSVELELTEVKGYVSKHQEQSGMERFSIYFQGPAEPQLPQKLYSFQHAQMGSFEMFIVPIARNGEGFRYESVFNYFKSAQ